MAEKSEMSIDEKIALAKETYSRGSRNYLVKDYAEAADDFSKSTQIYTEIYGPLADELGLPYLMYAKSLVALAQTGDNKLLEMPTDEDGNDEDDEDSDEDADENEVKDEKTNGDSATTNGSTSHIDNEKPGTSSGSSSSAAAGGSSSNDVANDEDLSAIPEDEDDSGTPAENLQIAWEILEMAVPIFERQGTAALENLAEAYFELAEIAFENSHLESAINDYKRSLEIRMKTTSNDLRVIAEIQYKIGLGYLVLTNYDGSIAALNEAKKALDSEIDTQKSSDDPSAAAKIKEIEELKVEIENKIVEIEEERTQSVDEVKKELSKLIGKNPFGGIEVDGQSSTSTAAAVAENGSSSCAGASSSNEANKPKPSDISHLIKRKKPDTIEAEKQSPAAKRPSVEK